MGRRRMESDHVRTCVITHKAHVVVRMIIGVCRVTANTRQYKAKMVNLVMTMAIG